MGTILVNIPSPDLVGYVARFADIDAKIAIFNHQHSSIRSIQNPYYSDDKPTQVDEKIYFNGPMEDERRLRCLRVKI